MILRIPIDLEIELNCAESLENNAPMVSVCETKINCLAAEDDSYSLSKDDNQILPTIFCVFFFAPFFSRSV